MKMLLVEDDPNKRERILEYIHSKYAEIEVVVEEAYKTGLARILSDDRFDLVLLDMSLPVFPRGPLERGGQTLPFGGRDFLQQMKRRKLITPVAVITQYEAFGDGEEKKTLEELKKLIAQDYRDLCVQVIYYNATLDSWKSELKSLLAKSLHGGGE